MGRTLYEGVRPGRKHTIMSPEERDKGKPTVWDEIEIKGGYIGVVCTVYCMRK